jgi:hypothetical protein
VNNISPPPILLPEKCCVCAFKTEEVYRLQFGEIFGMANEYEQKINICPNCGFIYTANPFSEEALANRYKSMSKFEYDTNNNVFEDSASYKKRCLRQRQFLKNSALKINSLFEVGCASGYNLSIYAQDGVNVYGIEPSKANVASCKAKYGIELFCGMFSEYQSYKPADEQYDLVFLSHILEHIINPYDFMRNISQIAAGFVFIEVPVFDYKLCDEPFGMFAEEHINYFTFENLREIMKRLGFYVVDAALNYCLDTDLPAGMPCLSSLWSREKIHSSLASTRKPVFSSHDLFINYIKKSEEQDTEVQACIDSIENKSPIAVWGTGHHTSRLLGMTHLPDKNIVKFYDSDLRKKGMTYYGKTISPFDPSDMNNGAIETILISTYVAQKAILSVLNKNKIGNYIALYE